MFLAASWTTWTRGEVELAVDVGEVGWAVRGEMNRRAAMSLFDRPSRSNRMTSSSAGVTIPTRWRALAFPTTTLRKRDRFVGR